MYPSMPISAIARVNIDYTLPAREIGALLGALVREPAPAEPVGAEVYRRDLKVDVEVAASDSFFERGIMDYGEPSTYTCPACNGVLFRIQEGAADRFRCHTGHGFSTGSLLAKKDPALWPGQKEPYRRRRVRLVVLRAVAQMRRKKITYSETRKTRAATGRHPADRRSRAGDVAPR